MKIVLLSLILIVSTGSRCQEKLIKDLDRDKINDTVFLDNESSRIVSRLSTSQFQENRSKPIDLLGDQNGVRATKSGFELYSSYMRAGNACQFRFDTVAKKIQLIGMSVYEFGNAANDGSGEASVNLLTNTYIGKWNSFDPEKEKLIKHPIIKQKMSFGKMYLENFDDKILEDFLTRSSTLYDKQRSKILK